MTTEIQNNAKVLAQALEANFPFVNWEIEPSDLSAIAYGEIPVNNGKAEIDIWFAGKNAGCLIQISNEAAFAIATRENITLEQCLSEIQEILYKYEQQAEESIN